MVDDIEQQIQMSEFLTILIQVMKSIGESRITNQHRTVINGQMPCQSILQFSLEDLFQFCSLFLEFLGILFGKLCKVEKFPLD